MRQAVADWLPDETASLFVWLPTYRRSDLRFDGVDSGSAMPLELADLQRLDRWLAAHRAAILVKPHRLGHTYPAGSFERIRTIDDDALRSAGLSLSSLLAAADCLITDASSVWVDFLLLGRPLICCFPDLAEYRGTRVLNLEPYEEWFPGPVVTDTDGLLAELAVVAGGADPYGERREWLTRALHVHRDGKAAPRLLDALGL